MSEERIEELDRIARSYLRLADNKNVSADLLLLQGRFMAEELMKNIAQIKQTEEGRSE